MPTRTKAPAKQQKRCRTPLAPLPRDAVLLALDVSSKVIGYAVFATGKLKAASLIKAPGNWPSDERIRQHTEEVREVLVGYGVTHVVMEWQSHKSAAKGPSVQGLAVLGQAQGAVWGMVLERGLPVDLVSERAWTLRNGRNRPKAERAREVELLYPEYERAVRADPKLDAGRDMADALGLGYWRLSIR